MTDDYCGWVEEPDTARDGLVGKMRFMAADLAEAHYTGAAWLTEEAIARIETLEAQHAEDVKLLSELLAVIHRDGGQYQDAHGTVKAVADAMQLSSERIVEAEDVKRIGELVGALTELLDFAAGDDPEGLAVFEKARAALAASPDGKDAR